jgi:hypothetical protein
VTDAVDPSVLAEQRTRTEPLPDLLRAPPGADELPARDDSVRGAGQPCEFLLSRPALVVHDNT